MKDRLIGILGNERLKTTTHWTIFGLGAASLSASILASALNTL